MLMSANGSVSLDWPPQIVDVDLKGVLNGIPELAVYLAGKYTVLGLTKALDLELERLLLGAYPAACVDSFHSSGVPSSSIYPCRNRRSAA